MRNQHLLAALLLIASMTLGSFGYAAWTDNVLPVQELYNGVSCPNVTKVYLNQDNDADGIPDFYLYLNSNFILKYNKIYNYSAGQILRESAGTPYTTVQYYTPLPNMIYKVDSDNVAGAIDETTFWRASWVFPYNTPVRGIATTPNKVVFEQPADNDTGKNLISIVYDYRYKYAQGFDGNTISAYRYNQVASMGYMLNTGLTYITTLPGSDGNRKRSWSSVQPALASTDVCKNYELHRCGDGLIDTGSNGYASLFTGEICDDGALNGTPGKCPLGCGNAATAQRCGDEVIQPAGEPYNGNPDTISFEECDDGDTEGDTDGLPNGDDPATAFCSTICLPTFAEEFTEEFVND